MIHIIGVNHCLQHNGDPPDQGPDLDVLWKLRGEFSAYLRDVAASVCAACIAEEFNEDAVRNSHASCSIAKKVADELGIRHLYCEPSIATRRAVGLTKVSSKEDFEERERYWLKVLLSSGGDTIFLCGPDHVHSFLSLLTDNGFDARVVIEYYKQEYFG